MKSEIPSFEEDLQYTYSVCSPVRFNLMIALWEDHSPFKNNRNEVQKYPAPSPGHSTRSDSKDLSFLSRQLETST